jgi:hypothetical protein
MYAKSPPVVVLEKPVYDQIRSGMWVSLSENGDLLVNSEQKAVDSEQ